MTARRSSGWSPRRVAVTARTPVPRSSCGRDETRQSCSLRLPCGYGRVVGGPITDDVVGDEFVQSASHSLACQAR